MSMAAARDQRTRAWSGVAFAVLFVAGLLPLGDLIGSFGDSDATFTAYFAKGSNRSAAVLGGVALALAGIAFLWFLSHLRLSIDRSGALAGVVAATGTIFVALLFVATAALVTVPLARIFGEAFDETSVLRSNEALLPQLGYVVLTVFAMWTAAAMILATTLSARGRGILPRWLARLGYGASAFTFVLGPSVIGLFGLPVWVLGVSIHWFRVADCRVRSTASSATTTRSLRDIQRSAAARASANSWRIVSPSAGFSSCVSASQILRCFFR